MASDEDRLPLRDGQLQKRKCCACLRSVSLLQVNLTSMSGTTRLSSGKLGPAVISRIGKKLGVCCYETIPLGTDSLLFN